jgi:hypothetical protein
LPPTVGPETVIVAVLLALIVFEHAPDCILVIVIVLGPTVVKPVTGNVPVPVVATVNVEVNAAPEGLLTLNVTV